MRRKILRQKNKHVIVQERKRIRMSDKDVMFRHQSREVLRKKKTRIRAEACRVWLEIGNLEVNCEKYGCKERRKSPKVQ